ncbi:MAG: rhomboid family intramembrane serine protease [Gammaproteobacteria bacterium]|nr:rhomboid family intramembrane serine protease [Gammaproteobacteria bacterium]MDH3448757.1 rhomboid family intramembrane serine protease [Gammaproteobacteria bacterium]
MENQNRTETSTDGPRLRRAFSIALSLTLLLWVVKLVEHLGGFDFSSYGIYPRAAAGLTGILCAPFIHGSFAHLFANTAPVIVIGTMLLYGYPRAARTLLPAVYLGGGFAVWLFAREAYHIGASGLAFGMLYFVLTVGILRWDRRAIALSLVVFFLYGGMIWGILPESREVSFESHLGGAVIGMVLAFVLRHQDPPPARKQYSWEREDADGDDFDWPEGL